MATARFISLFTLALLFTIFAFNLVESAPSVKQPPECVCIRFPCYCDPRPYPP
ncbi:8890_t:CDS:1, partial [Ambispora gerdemannii]